MRATDLEWARRPVSGDEPVVHGVQLGGIGPWMIWDVGDLLLRSTDGLTWDTLGENPGSSYLSQTVGRGRVVAAGIGPDRSDPRVMVIGDGGAKVVNPLPMPAIVSGSDVASFDVTFQAVAGDPLVFATIGLNVDVVGMLQVSDPPESYAVRWRNGRIDLVCTPVQPVEPCQASGLEPIDVTSKPSPAGATLEFVAAETGRTVGRMSVELGEGVAPDVVATLAETGRIDAVWDTGPDGTWRMTATGFSQPQQLQAVVPVESATVAWIDTADGGRFEVVSGPDPGFGRPPQGSVDGLWSNGTSGVDRLRAERQPHRVCAGRAELDRPRRHRPRRGCLPPDLLGGGRIRRAGRLGWERR